MSQKISVFKISLDESFSNTNYAIAVENYLDIISKDLGEIAKRAEIVSRQNPSDYSIEYKISKDKIHNYHCSNLDKNEIKTLDKYLDKLKVF